MGDSEFGDVVDIAPMSDGFVIFFTFADGDGFVGDVGDGEEEFVPLGVDEAFFFFELFYFMG